MIIRKILAVLCVLTICFCLLPTPIHASGENWYGTYLYRKQLTVTGTVDGIQTNYQLKVTINRSAGSDSGSTVYVSTKCESDYDDIRFTKSDGSTLLHYWIESATVSTATVWVEFDSIAASPSTTVFYMYYGYASATSVSSGTTTFITFSDFETGSNGDNLNGLQGWVTWTGSVKISTDHAYGGTRSGKWVGPGASGSYLALDTSSSYELRLRFWKETATSSANFNSWGNGTKRTVVYADSDEDINYWDGSEKDTGVNITADAWQEMVINAFNYSAGTFNIYANGALAKSGATMQTSSAYTNFIGVENDDVSAGNDFYVDNLIIRKWTATEPSITSWAAEEGYTSSLDVDTYGYNSVTTSTVNLMGYVSNLGDDASVTCSFQYGTTESYGSVSSTEVNTTGLYDMIIIGLSTNTLYHFRAKVVGNTTGYVKYGSDMTFRTTITTSGGNTETFIPRTPTYAYQTGTVNLAEQLGTKTQEAFQGIALYFLGDASKDGLLEASWGMLLVLMVASIVFLGTGNSTIALLSSVPMVLIAVWVGAFPMVILWLLLACIVLYVGYHFALRGM